MIYQLGFNISRIFTRYIFTLAHTLPQSKTRRGFCNLALRQRWRARDTLNTILDETCTDTQRLRETTLVAQNVYRFSPLEDRFDTED